MFSTEITEVLGYMNEPETKLVAGLLFTSRPCCRDQGQQYQVGGGESEPLLVAPGQRIRNELFLPSGRVCEC